jgi:hypothetical protein
MRKTAVLAVLLLPFFTSTIEPAIATASSEPLPSAVVMRSDPAPREIQRENMQLAYELAKADGHRDPRVVQGIILQESDAGAAKRWRIGGLDHGAKELYFGLAQIKVSTARDVMKRYPELWKQFNFQTRTDDELKANLMLNDRFNLTIASRYLLMLAHDYGFKGRELLNAYNQGPGGVRNISNDWHYAIEVETKLAAWHRR